MKILILLSRHISTHLPIDAVEFIDPRGKVGLCVHYKDEDDLHLIRMFNIGDEELHILD